MAGWVDHVQDCIETRSLISKIFSLFFVFMFLFLGDIYWSLGMKIQLWLILQTGFSFARTHFNNVICHPLLNAVDFQNFSC